MWVWILFSASTTFKSNPLLSQTLGVSQTMSISWARRAATERSLRESSRRYYGLTTLPLDCLQSLGIPSFDSLSWFTNSSKFLLPSQLVEQLRPVFVSDARMSDWRDEGKTAAGQSWNLASNLKKIASRLATLIPHPHHQLWPLSNLFCPRSPKATSVIPLYIQAPCRRIWS